MIKKILPWIFIIFLTALLVIGISMKDSMDSYLSKMMKSQAGNEVSLSGSVLVDSLYNYSRKGLSLQVTFLEFGAKGCIACKHMEGVLDEIRQKYPGRVNVVFINTLLPENQLMMKYFGIATIPSQILLDKTGKEYFRHSGYISTSELEERIGLSN